MREKGFTATALLILAVCIGANLTVFALVDSILLRPLPFPEPDRLVTLYNSYPKADVPRDENSITNYYERRGRIAAFSGVAIYWNGTAIVGETGATQSEQIMRISPEFFATLGANPVLGREFTDDEMTPGADASAILSDNYWRQYFNADPHVSGRNVRVNGIQKTIVGVLPPSFHFLSSEARIYLPLSSNPTNRGPDRRHSGSAARMIARLKPDASLEQAQMQIDAHNGAVEVDDPEGPRMADAGFHTVVVPLRADHVASIRRTLILTQAGVLMLLFIGAVNLVSLLLVRASGRIKEVAIRLAIGASRARIVRDALMETTILTLAGGLGGLAVGALGIRMLSILGTDRLPLGAHVAFDGRLAAIALLGTVIMGILIGIPTAWFNLKGQLANALQSESRTGTASHSSQRLRHVFIVAQIALAFILLAGAGLLRLSLQQAMAVPSGFRPASVLSGQISLSGTNYRTQQSDVAFAATLIDKIQKQPGVLASGIVTRLPFSGDTIKSAFTVRGYVPKPGESPRGHYWYGVMGEYFATLGIPLRAGRYLTAEDSSRADRVCVVDEDFARHYWPNGDAIGQQLFQGSKEASDAEAFTVVGVVGPVKQGDLTQEGAQGAVYFPYANYTNNSFFVVTRTSMPAESFESPLRSLVRGIDPELPVTNFRTMQARIDDSLIERRSPALLIGIFAVVSLFLTAIGTYGVLSYAVRQRRREIGVRMALGAQPAQIRSQFLRFGMRMIAVGSILGAIGAVMANRVMHSMLFNVPALPITTLVITALIVIAVTLLACFLPSRQAARTSPVEALSGDVG